jgi:hypothetical protein
MGSIVQVDKQIGEQYNKLHVFEGSGGVDAAGWGVRERAGTTVGNSYISYINNLDGGENIKYVRFRVDVTAAPGDEVIFSIWYKDTDSLAFNLVYRYVITETIVKANYGAAAVWANNTEYNIELPTAVNLPVVANREYFICVFTSGAQLDLDTAGQENGAYYKAAADISLNSTYNVSALTLNDHAVSFEAFSEPDSWVKLLNGGAISLANDDWENGVYCTGDWTNLANIYGAGVATDVVAAHKIVIDVSGDNTLPTGDPWPGAGGIGGGINNTEFPDYTAYGVRALHKLVIGAGSTIAAGDVVNILVSDDDDSSEPTYGWQIIDTLDNATVFAPNGYVLEIKAIARWIKIVHTTFAGGVGVTIDDIVINDIAYEINNGNFPVDVLENYHHVWVENYPIAVAIRKLRTGNMSGGYSEFSKPFSNREYVD